MLLGMPFIVMIAMFVVFLLFSEAEPRWKIVSGVIVAIDLLLHVTAAPFIVPLILECVFVIAHCLYWAAHGVLFHE